MAWHWGEDSPNNAEICWKESAVYPTSHTAVALGISGSAKGTSYAYESRNQPSATRTLAWPAPGFVNDLTPSI